MENHLFQEENMAFFLSFHFFYTMNSNKPRINTILKCCEFYFIQEKCMEAKYAGFY